MRKNGLIAIFTLTTLSLSAQFGINGAYRLNNAEQWKLTPFSSNQELAEFLGNGPAVGIDYWFRLKNVRIEFLPELNAGFYHSTISEVDGKSSVGQFSFFFNTNIYFLNFKGDCDCPTFSKHGPPLSKGVFFQLSPGVSYWNLDHTSGELEVKADATAFNIGAGLGLDIGLSDLVTITPVIGLRYTPSVTWDGLSKANGGIKEWILGDETSNIFQTNLGIRLGFRLDQ